MPHATKFNTDPGIHERAALDSGDDTDYVIIRPPSRIPNKHDSTESQINALPGAQPNPFAPTEKPRDDSIDSQIDALPGAAVRRATAPSDLESITKASLVESRGVARAQDTSIPGALDGPFNGLDLGPPLRAVYLETELNLRSDGTSDQYLRTLPPDANKVAEECGLGEVKHTNFVTDESTPQWVVQGFLGKGSVGHVEEVKTHQAKRSFVRKTVVLRGPRKDRKALSDILQKEVETMKGLLHLHIVQLIGSWHSIKRFAILMSPVATRNLEEFFEDMEDKQTDFWNDKNKEKPFLEMHYWLRKWPICIASAVAYLHSNGVRHQDIKPSNIVHKGADVYLTDFSSCDEFNVEGTTSTGSLARFTKLYAPPESFLTGELGRRGLGSEMFSLGCVLLEIEVLLQAGFHRREGNPHGCLLSDFHAFAVPSSEGDSPSNKDRAYSKARDRMFDWFGVSVHYLPNQYIFLDRVIKPMLASDRQLRPSAKTVVQRLRTIFPRRCACSDPYGPFGKVQPADSAYSHLYDDRRLQWTLDRFGMMTCMNILSSVPTKQADGLDSIVCRS